MEGKQTHRYYDPKQNRILYFTGNADAGFWDAHWDKYFGEKLKQTITSYEKNRYILKLAKQSLPDKKGLILEGGCGIGGYVYCLSKNGYTVLGVDYAIHTLTAVKAIFPFLQFITSDVRNSGISDDSTDLYLSFGVIEHFRDGYDDIIKEAYRILKKNGTLVVTFPQISFFRRLKIFFHMYPFLPEEMQINQNDFYQYLMDPNEVAKRITRFGFRLREKKSLGGLKGFKDEIGWMKPAFQELYDYAGKNLVKRGLRIVMNRIFERYCGHSCQMIFQKEKM